MAKKKPEARQKEVKLEEILGVNEEITLSRSKKKVKFRSILVEDIPKISDRAEAIIKCLPTEAVASGQFGMLDIVRVLKGAQDDLIESICYFTTLKKQEILKMDAYDYLDLVPEIILRNKNFFTQALVTPLKKVMGSMKAEMDSMAANLEANASTGPESSTS